MAQFCPLKKLFANKAVNYSPLQVRAPLKKGQSLIHRIACLRNAKCEPAVKIFASNFGMFFL